MKFSWNINVEYPYLFSVLKKQKKKKIKKKKKIEEWNDSDYGMMRIKKTREKEKRVKKKREVTKTEKKKINPTKVKFLCSE